MRLSNRRASMAWRNAVRSLSHHTDFRIPLRLQGLGSSSERSAAEPPPWTAMRGGVTQCQHQQPTDFEIGERLVARILQEPNGNHDWRWSVFAICPAIPGLTNGVAADPKESRRKVETAWQNGQREGLARS